MTRRSIVWQDAPRMFSSSRQTDGRSEKGYAGGVLDEGLPDVVQVIVAVQMVRIDVRDDRECRRKA
jgi:hypothetical protein